MSEKSYIQQILDKCHNPSPKSELLPYQYYDSEQNLFINKGSNVGFILEINPIVGVTESILKQLSLLFDEFLPENSFLQFMMIASSNISSITDPWLVQYENSDELLKSIAAKRVAYLKDMTSGGEGSYRIKNYRIIVSFSKVMKYTKVEINDLNNFRNQLESLLKSCGLQVRRMDVNDFMQATGDILSPENISNEYNPDENLNVQMDKANPLKFDSQKILHGINHNNQQYKSKCYAFEQTPKKFSLDLMINLLGDSIRDNLQIPGRLILSYTISNDISSKRQEVLKDKGGGVVKQADSYLVRFDNLIKKEIGEWSEALELLNGGKKLLSTSFTILLTEKTEDFSKAEQYLTSVYVTNGFKLKALDYFMLPGFVSCLPFGPSSGIFNLFKKHGLAQTTVSTTPLAFLPIHGEWKGNSKEGLLLAGRRGQVFAIDPFIGESNYNVNVIGQSGSGKSVLLQDMVANFLSAGTKVFVLDIGRSYEKLCNLCGGDFVEFKMDSQICLNPFDRVELSSNEAQGDFLSLILPILSKMVAPKRGTTDIEDSILSRCLQETWEKTKNKTTITDIAKNLQAENTELSINLATMLFQYSDQGSYGRFFNGKSNVDFSNRLTVIEFEDLRERRDLLSVIMQMLSAQIMTQVFSGNRQQRFVILFDEAWFALDLFPGLLASLARTIRKYNGSLILGTQSVNDFYVNDTAKSILENSGWLFMLKQKKESVDLLMESKRMSLDTSQINLIKSLNVVPGKYSECLISSSGGYVVGRLILDPYSKILYSTSPTEFAAVQKLVKSGITVNKAVEEVARNVYGL
jgi:conjugal transfer ATP-binding protein TraC